MKNILITHTDLDGAGCAIIFDQKYPDIKIQYHDYDTIDEIAQELWNNKDNYHQIFFADITPSEEIGMKMINYSYDKFILIDHHITREYLRNSTNDNVIYNTEICATQLTAEYLKLPDTGNNWDFVMSVDAYDMWKLNSPYREQGVKLNLLFHYYGMDKFIIEFYELDIIDNYEENIIEVLKNLDQKYLAKKLEQGKILTDKNGNIYFQVYVCENSAPVGMLVDDPDFPPECEYVKSINPNTNTVGLYSKEFDVSKIAKENGGGGHIHAAGYQIDTDNIK